MPPVRVLQIITRLVLGGSQETVLLTCRLLDSAEWRTEILCGAQTGPEGSLFDQARAQHTLVTVEPALVREVSPFRDLVCLWRLYRFIRRGRFDVVHTHDSKAGVLGRIAARMAGVPVVHTIHGWGFTDRQRPVARWLFQTVERFCARFADKLIAVTGRDVDKGLAAGIGRAEQYQVIRSGIELARFGHPTVDRDTVRRQLGLPADAVVVGTVTRLSEQKAPLDFVRAAAEVRQTADDLDPWFVLVGDGPLRSRVEALVEELGLRDRLLLTGLRHDVPELLAAFDLFVLSSLWEGLPRVLPQAMATGLPVVATAVDGNAEIVEDGLTGRLVPPARPELLAAAVVELLGDPVRRATMGAAGRARVEPYSAERMAADLAALYRRLTA